VDANGYGSGRGEAINIDVWSMPGEFDDQLKWPARANFTIELVNQQGGENVTAIVKLEWNRPTSTQHARYIAISEWQCRTKNNFVEHTQLVHFLKYDTLYFYVSNVQLLLL